MSRLVAFGCSHTYGYGLPDISHPNQSGTYSQLAWPSLLSKELSRNLVNKAFPGWSNTKILHEILSFDYQADDLVIVLWATIDRDLLFMEDGSELNVGCWNEDTFTKQYYCLHSDLDMAIKTLTCIHHSDIFFKNKNVTAKHFLYTNKFYKVVENAKDRCKWFDTPLENAFLYGMMQDRASDNLHFGVETHRVLSNFIKGKI